MTKPKSTAKAATRSASPKSSKSKSRKRPTPASSKSAARPATKHARIIAMLRTPAGATIAAIMTATEWQQHSVCGFFAGVVRKKLGLNLTSEETEKGRVYRIKDGKASIQCFRSSEAGGLMRCRRNVAMVVPRPKLLLRTRSRICAVSILGDFVRAGRACFKDRPLLI